MTNSAAPRCHFEPCRARSRAADGERRPRKGDGLVRRLALAKLRELRAAGMSFREIGRHFSTAGALAAAREPGETPLRGTQPEAAEFLRALDAVEQGLAFFTRDGKLLHANRSFRRAAAMGDDEGWLLREARLFVTALSALVSARKLDREAGRVEALAVRELPLPDEHARLRGCYVGIDLFGCGGTVMVTLERPLTDALCDEMLRLRFGLSRQEARIARLLVEGRSNAEIAGRLFLSPHTVRRHTENIFRKLGTHSRAEVALRVLGGGARSRSPPGEHPDPRAE